MNVVIYARYSSHSQTEQSIEGQLAVCREYAQRNNYTIVGEYIDRALSGTNDKRPQFQKMIEDSNKKYFEGVLVYQLDRFARNRYDSATYKNKLKKNGVRVFSARENISDDASGVLIESILEGYSEYFSLELSQKVIRGMKLNAEKGLYNGGTPPLGYTVNNDKKYVIDEKQAQIVRKIFDMYINGCTMAEIIRYLNDNNIKTSYNNNFNKNSIRRILLNQKYIGTYKFGDIEIKNCIPQIIDNITFDKVSQILLKNKKAPARAKAKTEYLLTTKLFCGNCKEMMVGVCGTSKTGNVHNYYSCNGKRKNICDKKNIKKDYIENLVIKTARNQLTEKNINEMTKILIKVVEKEKNSPKLKNLKKKQKDIEKQKLNLMNSLKLCDIDSIRKSIFGEMEKMDKEQKQVENEILIENAQHLDITEPQIKFFLNNLKDGDINDIRYRKLLIDILINAVYVYDDHLILILNVVDNKNNIIKVPLIEDLESSFLGTRGARTTPSILV